MVKQKSRAAKGRTKKAAKPRKAAGTATTAAKRAAADRATIASLRAENKTLRAELAALRKRETTQPRVTPRPAVAAPAPAEIPTLPLFGGTRPPDPAA